jgi:hypothetical protein
MGWVQSGAQPFSNYSNFTLILKYKMKTILMSINLQTWHGSRVDYSEQLLPLGPLPIPNRIPVIKFGRHSTLNLSLIFYGVQIFLKKSDKFSKIISSHNLYQNEFSWVHLCVRFRVTKQVSNRLVRIKETSLNLKFNTYNISWMVKLARISFKLPNYIVSYYLDTVEQCSCYNDTRGVTPTKQH